MKMFKRFLMMPMYGTCSKYGIPRGHISRWHFEHSPSILHAPTFCIHVNQSTPHKDIQIPSNMNNLLMSTSSLFKCKNTGTLCIQHSHKGNRFGCTPSWFICQNSSSNLCPCPHFRYPNIMVVHVTTSQDGILLNTLQASSMCSHILNTCQPR